MTRPDLNLLTALDVLLAEGSVARAGRRLALSPSAMSRTLARLRAATGDPLLVRAGRGLVASPRALELRARVGALVDEATAMLRPTTGLELGRLERGFTLRTSEGFVENYGAALLARIRREAPDVRLRFVPKPDRDSGPLRDGGVDLEVGVVGKATSPEVHTVALFRDRFVGVVRRRHPLAKGEVTLRRYASACHVRVARPGSDTTPIDDALSTLGIARPVIATVGGYSAAVALARASDLVASLPERHTGNLRAGMHTFTLPLDMPDITVSLLWHPRMQADAAHRWLRGCVREICADGDRDSALRDSHAIAQRARSRRT
ncbi:MAG: LysR family transcriptional regulator [Burkholderiales bacterium]|nr:LysR family transcriptional regulator [Burkholderiales bacterium]